MFDKMIGYCARFFLYNTGKFGMVYRAQMNDTIVAVKVTKKYSSEKAMSDFQNETSIVSQVSHNNIVRLYGIINEGVRHDLSL